MSTASLWPQLIICKSGNCHAIAIFLEGIICIVYNNNNKKKRLGKKKSSLHLALYKGFFPLCFDFMIKSIVWPRSGMLCPFR